MAVKKRRKKPRGRGWHEEPERHALARRGIKTVIPGKHGNRRNVGYKNVGLNNPLEREYLLLVDEDVDKLVESISETELEALRCKMREQPHKVTFPPARTVSVVTPLPVSEERLARVKASAEEEKARIAARAELEKSRVEARVSAKKAEKSLKERLAQIEIERQKLIVSGVQVELSREQRERLKRLEREQEDKQKRLARDRATRQQKRELKQREAERVSRAIQEKLRREQEEARIKFQKKRDLAETARAREEARKLKQERLDREMKMVLLQIVEKSDVIMKGEKEVGFGIAEGRLTKKQRRVLKRLEREEGTVRFREGAALFERKPAAKEFEQMQLDLKEKEEKLKEAEQ